jgi:2-dehydro-3-deoxyphosphogluconate aldolase/(4S)-4-hydroxy-2-oxoglutarate aldolase
MSVLERIRAAGVLPVVEIPDPAVAVPLAAALREAGLSAIEITFRTDAAAAAIEAVRTAHPDMLVGAGTVLTTAQLENALEHGAQFVVSPGFSQTIVRQCVANGTTVLPGVCTPTEVQMGLDAGLRTLKFFRPKPQAV